MDMMGVVKSKETKVEPEQEDEEKAETKVTKEKVKKHKKKKVPKEDAGDGTAELPPQAKPSRVDDKKESAATIEDQPKESTGKKDDEHEEEKKRQKRAAVEKVTESKESDAASVKKTTEESQETTKAEEGGRRRKIKDPDFFRKLFDAPLVAKVPHPSNEKITKEERTEDGRRRKSKPKDDEEETNYANYIKKVVFENADEDTTGQPKPSSPVDPKATKLMHHKRARNMKDFKKMLFESHLLDDQAEDRDESAPHRKKDEHEPKTGRKHTKHDRKTPKRRWTIVILMTVCY